MSIKRFAAVLKKDIALGPRSPIVSFAVFIPIFLTIVLQLVFGDLFSQKPALALVDQGSSEVARLLQQTEGIDVVILDSSEVLKRRVLDHDFDGGLVLSQDFDHQLKTGQRPLLEIYISGESYAVNRLVLMVTSIDLLRQVEGRAPPIDIEMVQLGRGEDFPISMRLVPILAMYAFIIAGLFVPASSLVEERERRTITAMLATPVKLHEILWAKAVLGVLLSMVMTVVTLILNNSFSESQGVLLLVLLVSSVFWAVLGLIIGLVSSNSQILFALIKGTGIFLFGPAVFYLFPNWPQWIAKLFPTYWAIDPLWQVLAHQSSIQDVLGSLLITLAITLALIPVVKILGRRMLRQLASS